MKQPRRQPRRMMRPRLMTPMKPKRREVSVESVEVERPWFLPAADQLQLHPVVEQHWGENCP